MRITVRKIGQGRENAKQFSERQTGGLRGD